MEICYSWGADEDGYCRCSMCQDQKRVEKEKGIDFSLPEELFEL